MTNNTNIQPSRGQLQRTLSQKLQKLYREELDHLTGKVTCQLFDDKLTVIIEDSLTQPEQILLEKSNSDLVGQIRTDLDAVMRPKVIELVKEVLGVEVCDIMSDTTLETGRTGMIVLLASSTGTDGRSPQQAQTIAKAS